MTIRRIDATLRDMIFRTESAAGRTKAFVEGTIDTSDQDLIQRCQAAYMDDVDCDVVIPFGKRHRRFTVRVMSVTHHDDLAEPFSRISMKQHGASREMG